MNNNNAERLLEKILFTLENIERAIRNEPKQRVPDVVYHFSDKTIQADTLRAIEDASNE